MADRDEEQPSRSFKVADRRRFVDDAASDDRDRETEREREPERGADRGPSPIIGDAGAASHDSSHAEADAGQGGPPPEMSFSTFVIGLTTQALMHLGEIADPTQQDVGRDLPAAKQMIDLLGILRDKTKGNLDQAEAQLLDTMLYDLRMRFVEVSRSR
jgi:hypothetical protein